MQCHMRRLEHPRCELGCSVGSLEVDFNTIYSWTDVVNSCQQFHMMLKFGAAFIVVSVVEVAHLVTARILSVE